MPTKSRASPTVAQSTHLCDASTKVSTDEGQAMFAVFGKASLDSSRMDEIIQLQNSVAVPMAAAQAGHVATYISHSADGSRGASIYVFETKEQAEAFAASMKVPAGAPVTIESLEVFEVTAHG